MSAPLTISEVAGLQTSKYFNVAGMAVFVYDYAITVEEEITWVWGRRWDITRIIFTTSRYLPFLGIGMTAYSVFRSDNQPCPLYTEENIIHSSSIIAAELLMILRTYTFWHGDRRILYGLLIYGVATIVASGTTSDLPNENLIPGGKPPPGCYFEESRNSTFMYALLSLYEIVMLILVVYRRFRAYRGGSTAIVHTVYNDGVFYIISIISISVANLIIIIAFPIQYSNLLDIPQFILHSVLASRILFNLRKEARRADLGGTNHSSTRFLTTMEYHAPSSSAEATGTSQEDIELVRLDGGGSSRVESSGNL